MNNLKEKLKKNLPTIGSWVTIGHGNSRFRMADH